MNSKITLILGGARSGKSRRAEQLAAKEGRSVIYVATYATKFADNEMQDRITQHQSTRPPHWITIENDFNLTQIFQAHPGKTVLIDCLTLWLSYHCETLRESEILDLLAASLREARTNGISLFVVSNELGMGLVPSTALGRSFRDLCGRANQQVAEFADGGEFQIAGLPLALKGGAL
jgi:adenosylcobinamide kinase/adenosylcobinamide-phosphate guanylyltransferase